MTGSSDTREKLRAAVLAFVMVTSVFGATVAFSGTALAQSVANDAGPADVPGESADESQDLVSSSTLDINGLSNNQHAIKIDVSELDDAGADLSGADVSASASTGTVDFSNYDAADSEIQLIVTDATSDVTINSLTLSGIDTSGVSTANNLQYTIRVADNNGGDFDSNFQTDAIDQTPTFDVATIEVENLAAGETITTTSLADAIDEANDPTSNDLSSGSAGDQVEIRLNSGTYVFDTADTTANGISDDNTRLQPIGDSDVVIQNSGDDTTIDVQATGVEIVNITFNQDGQAHEALSLQNDAEATVEQSDFTNSDGTNYVDTTDDTTLDISSSTFDDPNDNNPNGVVVTDGPTTDDGDITLTSNEFDGLQTAIDVSADLTGSGDGLVSFSASENDFGVNVRQVDDSNDNAQVDLDTIFENNEFEQFAITTDDSDGSIVAQGPGHGIYGDLEDLATSSTSIDTADTTTTLSAGSHSLDSPVGLSNDNVDIIGASGADAQNVTVDVSNDPIFSVTDSVDGLTIDGITFETESNAVLQNDGAAADTLKNVEVTNNRFVGITDGPTDGIISFGVATEADVASATIASNTFEASADAGNDYKAIVFGDLVDDGNPTEVVIDSNAINGSNTGGIEAGIDDTASNEFILDIVNNDIEVTGGNAGIDLENLDNNNDVEDVQVRQNTLTAADSGTGGSGIEVSAGSTAVVSITNNDVTGFSNNGGEGIDIDDSAFDESGLTVEDNVLDNNGEQIHFDTNSQDADTLRSSNTLIQLVEVLDEEDGSLQTDQFYGTIDAGVANAGANEFVAVGPATYDEDSVNPGSDGITIKSTDGPTATTIVPVDGSEIFNLDDDGVTVSGFTIDSSESTVDNEDILAENSDGGSITVSNNVFVGTEGRVAVEADGSQTVDVRSNEISGYDAGVEADTTSGGTTLNVVENQITDNAIGVDISGADSVGGGNVNFNDIVNNDIGLENDESDDVVDAKANWWGATTGPSGAEFSGDGDEIAGGTDDQLADGEEVQPWQTESISNLPTDRYVVITDPDPPVADDTDTPAVVVAVLNETIAGNTGDTNTRLIADPSNPISGAGAADAGTAATTADPLEYNSITSDKADNFTLTARDTDGNVRQGSAVQTYTGQADSVEVTVESDTLVADGDSTVNVTLTVVDSNGTPVAVGAEEVEYLIDNGTNAGVTREVEETATDDSSPTSEARLEISAENSGFNLTVTGLFDSGGTTAAGGASDTVSITTVQNQLDVSVSPETVVAGNSTDVTIDVTNAETGAGVNDATVDLSGAGVSQSVLTNSSGVATTSVNASEAGTIEVNVSADGFDDATESITVEPAPAPTDAVQIENVNLDPSTVSANTTNDHDLTFDAVNVSDDGNTDSFTVTIPSAATLESANSVSVVDANGTDVSLSGGPDVSGNEITFDVAPDSSADTRTLSVTANVTVAAPDVENETTADITVDVSDSNNGQASANVTLTVEPADAPVSDPVERFDTNGEPGIQDDEVLNAISAFNEGEEGVEAGDVLDVISAFNEA